MKDDLENRCQCGREITDDNKAEGHKVEQDVVAGQGRVKYTITACSGCLFKKGQSSPNK